MDYLDLMLGKYYQTMTGKYFEDIPIGHTLRTEDGAADSRSVGIPFDYETVNPAEWHYKNLLSNLVEKEAATLTVKTREAIGFRVGSYVLTMDGRLCEITSVTEDVRGAGIEAMRLMPLPLGTEYILRLTERENPFGIS